MGGRADLASGPAVLTGGNRDLPGATHQTFRLTRAALCCACLLASASCVVAGRGTAVAEVQRSEGAAVVEIAALGLDLRTAPAVEGLGLGFARRTLVYPADLPGLPDDGVYVGGVALPEGGALLVDLRQYGLDASIGGPVVGVTLGFAGLALRWGGSEGETAIAYARGLPWTTTLERCGEDACADLH